MKLSPGLAIGWQLWRQNRIGIVVSAATLPALGLLDPAVRYFAADAARGDAAMFAGAVATIPIGFVFAYLMNALMLTEERGNFATGYPRRSFTLPLSTRSLAAWPMLYAGVTLAVLWCATALLYRTFGLRLPLGTPAAAFVAGMAWVQAVAWLPLNQWFKIALIAVSQCAVIVPGVEFVILGVNDAWTVLWFAADAALAYAVARTGLAQARRGETWRVSVKWPGLATFRRGPNPFRSAAAAQTWYEWRCHGLLLPAFAVVNGVLLAGIGLLTGAVRQSETTLMLVGAILGLGLMSSLSLGSIAARAQPLWVKETRPFPFVLIRPTTAGAIAAAKFRMVAKTACVITAVSVFFAAILIAANGGKCLPAVWNALTARRSAAEAAAILTLAAVLYPVTHWRQATGSLAPGLTGRNWTKLTFDYLGIAAFAALGCGALWVAKHPSHLPYVLTPLPWLLAGALCIKAGLSAGAFRAACRRGLLTGRAAAAAFGLWLTVAAAILALATLLTAGAELPVPRVVFPLGAALAAPLARFALCPLAIDWARHR